jgi:hypothetical protein
VCTRDEEREKESEKERNKVSYFLKKNELPPKIKIKNIKNALLEEHRAGVPCCPVRSVRI